MTTANSTIDSVKNSAKSTMSSARGEANEFTGKEKLNQAYKLAGEAASDMVDSVKHKAESQYHERKDQAGELAGQAESYIKEKPLVAIGAAFVAGWAISRLFSK